jgi:hypothetical protein
VTKPTLCYVCDKEVEAHVVGSMPLCEKCRGPITVLSYSYVEDPELSSKVKFGAVVVSTEVSSKPDYVCPKCNGPAVLVQSYYNAPKGDCWIYRTLNNGRCTWGAKTCWSAGI